MMMAGLGGTLLPNINRSNAPDPRPVLPSPPLLVRSGVWNVRSLKCWGRPGKAAATSGMEVQLHPIMRQEIGIF